MFNDNDYFNSNIILSPIKLNTNPFTTEDNYEHYSRQNNTFEFELPFLDVSDPFGVNLRKEYVRDTYHFGLPSYNFKKKKEVDECNISNVSYTTFDHSEMPN